MFAKGVWVIGIISVGLLASWFLLLLFRPREDYVDGQIAKHLRWTERWAFTPQSLGGFSYQSLILVSVVGLFLELLLIRWVSCEIRIFAYFKNFVLIACFLGFGLGCYLCHRPINLLSTIVPLVFLVLLITLPIPDLRYVIDFALSRFLGVSSEVDIWYVPSHIKTLKQLAGTIAVNGVAVPIFLLISLTFVPIGQLLGWYLENAPNGILAYTVNILASLAGILLFTLLCFLELGPVVWFGVSGMMLLLLLWKVRVQRWALLLCFALCIGLLTYEGERGAVVYWSPYQKLAVTPVYSKWGELLRYHLETNNAYYQQILNLSDDFVEEHPQLFQDMPLDLNPYNLPYRFKSNPESVLVLGSGMGNDVAAAIRNGADRVVAVEIDPTIFKLGKHLHFEKPYHASKVEVAIEDARNYVEKATDHFDMILFALLDSHTTSSHYTNIRTDHYVYTVEALEATKRLLKPDGVMVIKFQVNTPWIAGRLEGLLTKVFGHTPLQIGVKKAAHTTGGRFFVTGFSQPVAGIMSDEILESYIKKDFKIEHSPLTTDNWPYFYQKKPGIPGSVVIISVLLIIICTFTLGRTGTTVRSMRWHFFFLGAGFLLLEVHIVSKMALLFGTTWLVNSIVIGGLLLMIVAANILVLQASSIPTWVSYSGLFITILLSYILPPGELFVCSLWLRIFLAGTVLCLPVFFAGIIFIQSFAMVGFSGEALGSNLIGSLVGGLLEALSFWTGIKALLLIGASLYLFSLLTLGYEQRISVKRRA